MTSLVELEQVRPGFTDNLTGSAVEWIQYDQTENGLVRILEDVGKAVLLRTPGCRRAEGHAVDNDFVSRSAMLDDPNQDADLSRYFGNRFVLHDTVGSILSTACSVVAALFDHIGKYRNTPGDSIYLIHPPKVTVQRTDHGRFVYWYHVQTSLVR